MISPFVLSKSASVRYNQRLLVRGGGGGGGGVRTGVGSTPFTSSCCRSMSYDTATIAALQQQQQQPWKYNYCLRRPVMSGSFVTPSSRLLSSSSNSSSRMMNTRKGGGIIVSSQQQHQQQQLYPTNQSTKRFFQSEADYHTVADDTLIKIQDAVEQLLEDVYNNDDDDDTSPTTAIDNDAFDVNLASGVLTMVLPPHGTWVLNKQTPNQQIWWSSPISGPRRYEYHEDRQTWVYTRDVVDDIQTNHETNDSNTTSHVIHTLEGTLQEEIRALYQLELEIE